MVSNVSGALEAIVERAAEAGFAPERIAEIELCVEEALVNICNYAYPGMAGDIDIEPSSVDESGLFSVVITDSGIPFDPTSVPAPDVSVGDVTAQKVGGMGIHLMKEMTDDLYYCRSEGRNALTLCFRAPGDREEGADEDRLS